MTAEELVLTDRERQLQYDRLERRIKSLKQLIAELEEIVDPKYKEEKLKKLAEEATKKRNGSFGLFGGWGVFLAISLLGQGLFSWPLVGATTIFGTTTTALVQNAEAKYKVAEKELDKEVAGVQTRLDQCKVLLLKAEDQLAFFIAL